MDPISLRQLIQGIEGLQLNPSVQPTADICGISIDSRTIEPQQAFFAISGQNFDGHSYAAAAIEKGAACVIVEKIAMPPQECRVPMILTNSTVAALGRLAAWYRQQLSAKVIGITGSVGKTTTRHILYQVLSARYKCRQAQKSFNNHIGLPLTILSAQKDDDILLLEMGTNHPGEIAVLTNIANPDAAVITRVSPAHLEGFGSVEAILKEKASIALGVKPDGTVYLNGDQPELATHIKTIFPGRVVTFGTTSDCDIAGTDLETEGCSGYLSIEGRRIKVPLAGRANLMNVLTVWAICKDFNITLSDFQHAVEALTPIPMRLQIYSLGRLTILDDCYNANPVSMANALSCLHSVASQGRRKVFLAGCMAELGAQSAQLHRELGAAATAEGVEILLAAGPFAKAVLEGAVQAGLPPERMAAFEKTDQLCDNLHKWIQADDIILIKGSRSAGMEKSIVRLRDLFEKQCISNARE
ncbi:MAG TPA: UDP-N-acetylmuramoyl-tripeptide--D-alanyl-D-alanine ligase [Anaerohalosphaeraceae bacterium]|nr:UDP-N-acetylmuramoyl-tripeptide--D-alanyl-D-alanine ligase [Anaerohalosphaeraceae bacterium]HOM75608.1 UDP-N-acetylmuramoyl-tripeptide--D-alanyl-D-alanine ligase [Anaerohalosphaeraceae bacterium]HPC65240.1 UDP-N-acetylmuramoyl-tripeptide--D-alanyl-D-alanine ligase [Anaerohalosphaeraceae bacterium]HPO69527.1 UDP-N-acetylmuramoyl-tripeptide--D-alanyl-D-alanine ligase [Anaerohalosphaeraceae bacterium]HRS72422.1 UDP-N-acetylmuramoyl-tripeptide--D-alanyl-D-alanine ligase [Anaerohalosphaeraceae ba